MIKIIIISLVIILLALLIADKHYLIVKDFWKIFSDIILYLMYSIVHKKNPNDIESYQVTSLESIKSSSIWCWNRSTEISSYCRFESICLRRESNDYVFIEDYEYSTNLKERLKWIETLKLSPVVDHNRFDLKKMPKVPIGALDHFINNNDDHNYLIPGVTILMSRFKPNNFLHLVHDDLLPLLATLREQSLIGEATIFFDDHWLDAYGFYLFEMFSKKLLFRDQFPTNSIICFQNALIGLTSSTIWYQYGFRHPQSSIDLCPKRLESIRMEINWLRRYLFKTLQIETPDQCSDPEIVLILRKNNRKILNSIELEDFFRFKFPSYRMRSIEVNNDFISDRDKLRSLIQSLVCTRIFLSMHGSEQIFSIFIPIELNVANNRFDQCPIKIIELFPYGIDSNHSTIYKTLAESILGYCYYSWTNPLRNNTRFPDLNIKNEISKGLASLDRGELIAVKEKIDQPLRSFLCCNNPHWLFRIYQDTIVDLNLFEELFREISLEIPEQRKLYLINNRNNCEFQLSSVENLRCEFIDNRTKISIQWNPPWNLALAMNYLKQNDCCYCQSSKYQIIYQIATQRIDHGSRNERGNARKITLKNTPNQMITLESKDFDCFNCWVRIVSNQCLDGNKYDQPGRKTHNECQFINSFNQEPLFCCP